MNRELPTVSEIIEMIKNGTASPDGVCRSFLSRAENDALGAFITLTADAARDAASAVGERLRRGEDLPLAGVPVAVKDNICTAGVRCTCASKMLENFIPTYSATAWERLRAAGAVLVGKTNLDEFAMGSSGETSFFGMVKNPYDPSRVAGGSSSGSAAAVAAGYAAAALGSDTGGSSRLPASFCGLVALKPTYGTVSRFGLVSFAPSLEQICPMTLTVCDAELIYRVIAGRDPKDMTSTDPGPAGGRRTADMKIALWSPPGVTDDVRGALRAAADMLASSGASVTEIDSFFDPAEAAAVYMAISSAEASSTLSRYDGIRFGFSGGSPEKTRGEGFGKGVIDRLLTGAYVLTEDGGSRYLRALSRRAALTAAAEEMTSRYDVILMPAARSAAHRPGEGMGPAEDGYSDVANLSGMPSLAVPVKQNGDGLPVGVGLLAGRFREADLFAAGRAIERARGRFPRPVGEVE